jgi:hypothetical protein
MGRFNKIVLFLGMITLCSCQDLVPHDTQSLLSPKFRRSEIFGFVAGLGTTFAAVPDLVAMLRRHQVLASTRAWRQSWEPFKSSGSTTVC